MRTYLLVSFALLLVCAFSASALAQCPSWVRALAAGNSRLADGFCWSILFMVSAPFVCVGTMLFIVVRAFRRAAREAQDRQRRAYLNPN